MSDTTTPTATPPAAQPAPAPAASTTEQPKPQAPQPATPEKPKQGDPADAPLGEPGLKALREEREARERLEQAMKDQRSALLKAFGVETDKPGEDIVKTLQEQVSAMQRDSLVDRVARRHGITDDDDVAFLRTASDEATMQRLAERLKTNPAPTSPAPDPSQGSAPLTEEAAAQAAYEAFYPSTPSK